MSPGSESGTLPECRRPAYNRAMKRLSFFLALLLIAVAVRAEDKPYGDVTIKVFKQESGKPVRNATVVLHEVDSKGKEAKGGINLKTDSQGKTSYNNVSYGTLRVQVIARGLQTFGQDVEIKQPQQEIVIKLQPPKDQYSIYGDQKKEPEKH
jgi:hypothetical protein